MYIELSIRLSYFLNYKFKEGGGHNFFMFKGCNASIIGVGWPEGLNSLVEF